MELDIIAAEVKICQKCDLCNTRIQAVPGKGNPNAAVILVGEAPGRSEDKLGEPFVGFAGNKLDSILNEIGIKREDVYITNIVKCRPPDNRIPTKEEEFACLEYINHEISTINPKVICVMGNTAYGTLLNGKEITKNHGKFVEKDGRTFFVTYHPAATIYNQKLITDLKNDFRKLAEFLKNDDSHEISNSNGFEERWCNYCVAKTKHTVVKKPKIVTRKRRWLFKCTKCNHEYWLQPYRTVAESLY